MKRDYYKSTNELDTLDRMLLEDGWMATAYFISGNIRKYNDRLGKKECKSVEVLKEIAQQAWHISVESDASFSDSSDFDCLLNIMEDYRKEANSNKIKSDYKKAVEYNIRLSCIMKDLSGEDYEFCGMLFDRNQKILSEMKEKVKKLTKTTD